MNNEIENKYKALLDLSSEGIHILDKFGNIIFYNKSFKNMLGYLDQEMKTLNVKDFDVHFKKKEIDEIINKLLNNKINSEKNFNTKHIKKDGTIIYVEINLKRVEIDNKTYLYASSKDITKDKLYEEELKKQKRELELEKRKLEVIIHNIPDLLWIKDVEGKYITCNKRFEEFFGAKAKDIIGKTDYDFVNKELADFFREHDKKAMNSEIPLSNFEEVEFSSDTHKEFLNTTKVKISDNKNNTIGVLGIGRDLSEIKKYQEKLENEKSKYKIFMESSSDAIFIVDLNGFVVEYSKLFKTTLGYDDFEILKLHVSDFEFIHTKEQIKENIKNVGFEPIHFETRYKKKDGTLFDVSLSIVKVSIDNKDYIYSSFRDITEQRELQSKIFKQKEEFETIFNYSHDCIVIVDLDTNFLKFNKAFVDLLECEEEVLLNRSFKDLILLDDLDKNTKILNNIIENGYINNIEKSFITKNGKKITVNLSASLLPDKKNILVTMNDISTLKIMEEQSKLASMGEMIGNIAHQWRQPLSVITTNISGLKLKSDLLGVEKNDIDICEDSILKQAKYLSDTIDNFRNFIKGDKENKEVSLKAILENALSLVSSSLHNNFITEIIDLKDNLEVFGNKNELAEAFINIFNNSKDALKSNIKNESDRLLFVSTKLLNKDSIEVKILDSGNGIKEEIIGKIFEPYFTTKHQSQGTGLGLSMADKIIRERHNGIMTVSNEDFEYNGKKYHGACFRILFSKNK